MRRVYKNLCPATISASIMAANMWKNSLKNVESDNNKILYENLLDFLERNGTYCLDKPRKSYLRVVKIFMLVWLRNFLTGIRYCVTGYADPDVSMYRSFFEMSDSNVILQEKGNCSNLCIEEREVQDKAA